jgi:hypothetical protein
LEDTVQTLGTTLLAFALALAACESNDFGGASGKSGKAKDAQGETCDDVITVKVGEQADVKDSPCVGKNPKKFESNDVDTASVGPDGTLVGEKPGKTYIEVVDEDGNRTKVPVNVIGDSSSTGTGTGGDTGDGTGSKPGGDLGEEGAGAGCQVNGDRIKWKWPKEVQDCFDDKKLWDFTRDECTTIPEATSYDCDWDGIDSAIQGIDANFTPDWDKKRLKIISCGEKEKDVAGGPNGGKKKTVVWQYVMLPKEAKNGKCDFSFGAGIAIGCFSATKFSLAPSSDPSDLHACIDD